jgi:hypothetical protein
VSLDHCLKWLFPCSLAFLVKLTIDSTVKPAETLLVVDAMTGQEAASLTASFDSAVGITGAILTKLDGDSRGGAAVSVRGVSGKPVSNFSCDCVCSFGTARFSFLTHTMLHYWLATEDQIRRNRRENL